MALFIIINHPIHHIHHRLRRAEHSLRLIQPLITLEEGIRHLMPAAIILLLQILNILPVTRESRRTCLQPLQSEPLRLIPARHIRRCREAACRITPEVFQELITAHTPQPLLRVRHDLVTARSQDIRRQPVVSARHRTVPRFQMNIVSPMQRLLSVRRDIRPKWFLYGDLSFENRVSR